MRICAILVALLVPALPAHADQTTYTATLSDTVNNQHIALTVQQIITPGGTTTTLYYRLADGAGNTVAEGNAAIPASTYTQQNKSTHRLKVQTPPGSTGPQGTIDVTWQATTERQETFTGLWTTRQGQVFSRVSEDRFGSTASVTGAVIGWNVAGYHANIDGTQSQVGK